MRGVLRPPRTAVHASLPTRRAGVYITLTAGPRYIRDCSLALGRGMVFVLTLEWARRCLEKALEEKPCAIETKSLHKNVSNIV